jgi:hypothetical protein
MTRVLGVVLVSVVALLPAPSSAAPAATAALGHYLLPTRGLWAEFEQEVPPVAITQGNFFVRSLRPR